MMAKLWPEAATWPQLMAAPDGWFQAERSGPVTLLIASGASGQRRSAWGAVGAGAVGRRGGVERAGGAGQQTGQHHQGEDEGGQGPDPAIGPTVESGAAGATDTEHGSTSRHVGVGT